MDLSKAFDCLPHNLLLLKLKTYGLSDSALNLLFSYLHQRKQCIKVENVCSNFKYMYKGVPQGSILESVLFKILINDILNVVNNSTIYNYADDNTLSYADYDIKNVVQNLESDSLKMLDWFDYNLMKANPAIGKKSFDHKIVFELKGNRIESENDVKLLGVTIDYELKFDKHISDICKKASRQLNVLKRIGKYLNKLGRLTIYYSFILSNLNYCPITWHFCSEKNTLKMEKIQERALRFVYNNYTIRDQPFNLKGGGYGFLFHSEIFFRTTQELEYFFVVANLTLGYMTKTLNQIIFSSTKIRIFFSATLGIRIFF
jgi:hypothetical protein